MQLIYRYIFLTIVIIFLSTCVVLLMQKSMKHLSTEYRRTHMRPVKSKKLAFITTKETNQDCRFHSCFNIFHCEPNHEWKIKVFVYPYIKYKSDKNENIFPKLSYEFNEIIQGVMNSEYYTNNISEACVFIPVLDILVEQYVHVNYASVAFTNLPRWNSTGENHLLFSFFPHHVIDSNFVISINASHSMVASTNFDQSNFRKGFDFSLPLFNSLTVVDDPNSHQIPFSAHRKWRIVVSQLSMKSELRDTLRRLEDKYEEMLMLRKCIGSTSNSLLQHKLCKDGVPFHYPDVLKDGDFCLIFKGHYFGTPLLLDAMMMGCVPVFVMDGYILPFDDVIDWSRASISIREFQLADVMNILRKYRNSDIANLRYQAFFLWKRYFSSLQRITKTLLDVLNDRVFENKRRSYEEWNGYFGSLQEDESFRIGAHPPLFLPAWKVSSDEGFTAVILTYNRVNMLQTLMKKLDRLPSLSKIVIVWNNPYLKPDNFEWASLSKSVSLVKMKTNRLTNRFYPFKEIATDAVMAIDDDILMLTDDEIEFAFQAWREFPDRLVGFPARNHIVNPEETVHGKKLKYKYESEWQNQLSMVLTGAAFYHKIYNHWFTYKMPVETKDYIDEKMNCEDIAMNFLISNLTRKSPIKVTPRKRFKCSECSGNDSLWSESSHFVKRSECLSVFTKQFGHMPLEPVEYRIDPLLFQSDVPNDVKDFPNVGTV